MLNQTQRGERQEMEKDINLISHLLSLMQSPSHVCDQQRDLHEDGVPAGRVPERSEFNSSKNTASLFEQQSQKHLLRITAERCRELSGWPRRVGRSLKRNGCHHRRGNTKPWANMA